MKIHQNGFAIANQSTVKATDGIAHSSQSAYRSWLFPSLLFFFSSRSHVSECRGRSQQHSLAADFSMKEMIRRRRRSSWRNLADENQFACSLLQQVAPEIHPAKNSLQPVSFSALISSRLIGSCSSFPKAWLFSLTGLGSEDKQCVNKIILVPWLKFMRWFHYFEFITFFCIFS